MPAPPYDPILDAPLAPAYPTGYQFWIAHWLQIIDAAKAWYVEANGHEPANTDIAHGLWRGLNEGERWGTLRRAWRDTWPLPAPPVPPVPPVPITTVAPWHREGLTVRDSQNAIQKLRGVTAFDAPRLFSLGQLDTLERYAAWTRSIGADVWRMFTMWTVTGYASTPATRAQLPALVEWCLAHGIRPWLVAFCDQVPGSQVVLAPNEQQVHWDAVHGVGSPYVLIEEWNERFKNDSDLAHLNRFSHAGLPLSARSSPADPDGPLSCGPLATFTDDHTARDSESVRKFKALLDTSRLYWNTGLPAFSGEPRPLQQLSPADAADYVVGCELMGAGSVLHDNLPPGQGPGPMQLCHVPTDRDELMAVEASRASWGIVPPHLASVGAYSRDDQQPGQERTFPILRCDSALRTYGMTDGDASVVLCPGGDVAQAVAVNGWKIADRRGFQNRVVFLTR